MHAACFTHLILCDLIILICGEACTLQSTSFCSLLQPPATSSLLGSSILLSTLFTSTPSLCSSLNMTDPVSQPYKTTFKIMVSYILIF